MSEKKFCDCNKECFEEDDYAFYKETGLCQYCHKPVKESVYIYAKPHTMSGHKFSDDVAICYAVSKKDALNKFGELYDIPEKDEDCVFEAMFNKYGICICTDY